MVNGTRCLLNSRTALLLVWSLACCICVVEGVTVTIGLLVPHNGARSLGQEAETTMDLAIEKIRLYGLHRLIRDDIFHNRWLICKENPTDTENTIDLESVVPDQTVRTAQADPGCHLRRYTVVRDLKETLINSNPELTNLRERNITFDYIQADTKCDIGTGLYELVQMVDMVDAFIGPACDSICEPVGLLSGKWNKPMISYSCSSSQLDNRDLYPTLARTTAIYTHMAYFLVDMVKYFRWDRVTIIEGPETIWRETAGHYQIELESHGIRTEILSIPSEDPHDVLEKHLIRAAMLTKIFIICAYGRDILYVLCAADTGALLDGNHAFFSIDFAFMTELTVTDRPCVIEHAYDGLMDLTIKVDEEYEGYQNFIESMYDKLGDDFGNEKGIHAAMLYDAVYLYALGLNNIMINDSVDFRDGKLIVDQLVNHSFDGLTGTVKLNVNGSRLTQFSLHNLHLDTYKTVAHHNGSMNGLQFLDNMVLYWPGGSTTAPLGRPVCGWENEFCQEVNNYVPIFTSTGMILLLIVSLSFGMAVYMYRKKKHQEKMESMSWKISYTDLDFRTMRHKGSSIIGSRATFYTKYSKTPDNVSKSRLGSYDSNLSLTGQVFSKLAYYKNVALAVKVINKQYVAITPALIVEMNEVRGLNHRNINPLFGACIEPMKICALSQYCSKGSLQDVLENDDIKLDNIFKISFAADIAKGMAYLHSSVVKCHGRLKSSNVYIDQQWTCKVGDFSLPVFRDGERVLPEDDVRHDYSLLWTAPELLRESPTNTKGTQKGDVFSFGIILQEIVLRTGPYGYMNIEPKDILEKLREKRTPPFRPNVPVVEGVQCLDDLMRMCWEEVPIFRPNFTTVLESLKKISNGKTTNLVDQMIHMMSRYADHLEELVKERTEQLEIEQKRTEDLLARMLPRSIANSLKVGKTVNPETYDCVTIYFSDIVGFTALASRSNPIEIVNFLNDLYTCFDKILEDYDVYKVETIGDAYMVVSGLPERNGNKHAGEIALMALDLLHSVTTFQIRHEPDKQLQVRIGIHSGPVCTGVVGSKMPRYCLFGDTVNYASRMESSGLALRIHVSAECKLLLEDLDGFYFECRGFVNMKGIGSVQTYILLGRQGFSKPLPDLSKAAPLEDHVFK